VHIIKTSEALATAVQSITMERKENAILKGVLEHAPYISHEYLSTLQQKNLTTPAKVH
jgi:hypothetical protein